jgi:tol-pal system protein YbgF
MRRGLLVLPLVAAVAGCATKGDVRNLRTEIGELRASQQATLEEIRRQNALLLDSVNAQNARIRGDLANQGLRLERQLLQVQELTGQGQQQVAQLREQIRAREAAAVGAPGSGAAAAPPAAVAPAGDPEELFNTALATLRRGSLATARSGFEEFLTTFPQHELAAEAQFYLGEALAEAEDTARALEAYALMAERYPRSEKAPTALYRAGTLELGRGNRDAARALFERLVQAYPSSIEAPLARDQIQRLGRR